MKTKAIIKLLKKDLKYDEKETIKHRNQFNITHSKKQKQKQMKHFHRAIYIKRLLETIEADEEIPCSMKHGIKWYGGGY